MASRLHVALDDLVEPPLHTTLIQVIDNAIQLPIDSVSSENKPGSALDPGAGQELTRLKALLAQHHDRI